MYNIYQEDFLNFSLGLTSSLDGFQAIKTVPLLNIEYIYLSHGYFGQFSWSDSFSSKDRTGECWFDGLLKPSVILGLDTWQLFNAL